MVVFAREQNNNVPSAYSATCCCEKGNRPVVETQNPRNVSLPTKKWGAIKLFGGVKSRTIPACVNGWKHVDEKRYDKQHGITTVHEKEQKEMGYFT